MRAQAAGSHRAPRPRIRLLWLGVVAGAVAAVALFGCRSPGALPQPEPGQVEAGTEYLPLRVGNTWTYTSRRGDLVIRVVDVRAAQGATEVTVEEIAGNQAMTQRTYRQDGMGLFLIRSVESGEVQDYSAEPQPVLLIPPQPGQRWVWRGQIGYRRTHFTAEVGQPETVSTPAGTFAAALPIQVRVMDWVMRNKALVHRQWLAPGIGPVRLDYQVEGGEIIRYELVAYSLQ